MLGDELGTVRKAFTDIDFARKWGTLAEEMSEAYKDISDVVDVVHNAGISKKVARLRPIGVIKG